MKNRMDVKNWISILIALGTAVSLGCMVMADDEVVVSEAQEETVAVEADNDKTDGWDQDDKGYWFYYENGSMVTGWKQIDGKWYFFKDNGRMYVGVHYDTTYDAYYIFGPDGAMRTNRWQQCDQFWYYLGENGKAVSGWQQIGNEWYYFLDDGSSPYAYRNNIFEFSEGKFIYLGPSGAMRTGWQLYHDRWYYFDHVTGEGLEGWQKIDGIWYYFAPYNSWGPYMYCDTIATINDKDGKSDLYAFDENGVMVTGWYNDNVETDSNGKKIYKGNWYYFDTTGKAVSGGWHKIDGNWYYFSITGKPYAYKDGFYRIDNVWYYFDKDTCAMMAEKWVGPTTDSSLKNWYYFTSDGSPAVGWEKIDGQWYYFKEEEDKIPYMATGYLDIGVKRYYLGNNGAMRTGWFKEWENWYYARPDGTLIKDTWVESGGKIYYLGFNGRMYTGIMFVSTGTFSSQPYDFGTDGVCLNPPKNVTTLKL